MIKSLVIIAAMGTLSYHYTDIGSESALRAVLMPVVGFCALVGGAFWIAVLLHKLGFTGRGGGGGDFGGFDGGGDFGGFGGGDGGGD
jgi:hypothetical protein